MTLSVVLVASLSALLVPGRSEASSCRTPTRGRPPRAGAYVFTIKFDGLTRDYRLHVPPAASSGKPLPLVLNLHGATQNAWLEEITSDMDPNADQNGYLVAYPDGTRISKVLTPDPIAKQAQYGWNVGPAAACRSPGKSTTSDSSKRSSPTSPPVPRSICDVCT